MAGPLREWPTFGVVDALFRNRLLRVVRMRRALCAWGACYSRGARMPGARSPGRALGEPASTFDERRFRAIRPLHAAAFTLLPADSPQVSA